MYALELLNLLSQRGKKREHHEGKHVSYGPLPYALVLIGIQCHMSPMLTFQELY